MFQIHQETHMFDMNPHMSEHLSMVPWGSSQWSVAGRVLENRDKELQLKQDTLNETDKGVD